MGKLHELLAVEPELKKTAKNAIQSVVKSFGQGQRFIGHSKIYRPLEEDGQPFPDDVQVMVTSVDKQLELFREGFGPWIDAAVQKELTNQDASETDEIGGRDFHLSATAWLNLEDKLEDLREIIADIPVNDQAIEWHWDANNEIWRSAPAITFKTEKVVDPIVGYEATPEHPAQVQWLPKDVRVGEWTKVLYSGMISANQKREALKRVNQLLRTAKQARCRANQVEVANVRVSDAIFDYIFAPY